jgi:hypothetical protein
VGGELISSEQEQERWNDLGKLLADELKEAARRTDAISSVPAFFTAHLRRRLARKPTRPAEIKSVSSSPQKNYSVSAADAVQNSAGKTPVGELPETALSKFSLEECLRYAEHLHATGQGITNPGGFAMTIHRSGISDALIEKFLHPTESEATLDASACPDCKGTGFYYPQGAEHGVVKCKHERLKETEAGRRLTPEEIKEQAVTIGELVESGYTMEQAEVQFAPSLDPEDWAAIRAQLDAKKVP